MSDKMNRLNCDILIEYSTQHHSVNRKRSLPMASTKLYFPEKIIGKINVEKSCNYFKLYTFSFWNKCAQCFKMCPKL